MSHQQKPKLLAEQVQCSNIQIGQHLKSAPYTKGTVYKQEPTEIRTMVYLPGHNKEPDGFLPKKHKKKMTQYNSH